MEPLIVRRSPLSYVVSVASILAPILVYWLTFKDSENWLVISTIYCGVLFGIPFLISLLLGFDFRYAVASEARKSRHQFIMGFNWGASITILVCGAYWIWTQYHSLSFKYNLSNKDQAYIWSIIFVFIYPLVEGIYYRMYLFRTLLFGPQEFSKQAISAIYGVAYFFALRQVVGSEEKAYLWAFGAVVWKRFLFHIRDLYGGFASMVTQSFANLSFVIIILFLSK